MGDPTKRGKPHSKIRNDARPTAIDSRSRFLKMKNVSVAQRTAKRRTTSGASSRLPGGESNNLMISAAMRAVDTARTQRITSLFSSKFLEKNTPAQRQGSVAKKPTNMINQIERSFII